MAIEYELVPENIIEGQIEKSKLEVNVSIVGSGPPGSEYDDSELRQEIGKKAQIFKLYFDGDAIFKSYSDFEDYNTITFDEIYDLCYDVNNYVYIGDGQMKYYPQLDLNVPTKDSESITFMSTAQLDGRNLHTRIIINSNNEVRTDQIIDAPMSEIARLEARIDELSAIVNGG